MGCGMSKNMRAAVERATEAAAEQVVTAVAAATAEVVVTAVDAGKEIVVEAVEKGTEEVKDAIGVDDNKKPSDENSISEKL